MRDTSSPKQDGEREEVTLFRISVRMRDGCKHGELFKQVDERSSDKHVCQNKLEAAGSF